MFKFLSLAILFILNCSNYALGMDILSKEDEFKTHLSKNLVALSDQFDKTKIPQKACKGCGLTLERIHIALASLLMEQTSCAAIFTTSKGKLWIGCNKAKEEQLNTLMGSISKLLKTDISPTCEALINNQHARTILGLSSNKGRFSNLEDQKSREAIRKSSREMVHWLKKILSLRGHMEKESVLGSLARNLCNRKVKFLITPHKQHAEMNILDQLYKKGLLFKTGGFIAISKKCCLKCAAALQAVNAVNARNETAIYQANGCHFKLYDWPIPAFIEKNEDILKIFLGKKAYKIYDEDNDNQEMHLQTVRELKKCDKKTKRNTKQDATNTRTEHTLVCTQSENAPSIINGRHKVGIRVQKR